MDVLKSKKNQITFYYGKQTLLGKTYHHTGIDIVKKSNSLDKIIAGQKGKVVGLRNNIKGFVNNSYGNYIVLQHSNNIRTMYCHLKYNSVKVKIGQIVNKGEVIAYMGDTGMAHGAHLHFEVRNKNKPINPLPYLNDKKTILSYGQASDLKKYTNGNYRSKYDMRVRDGAGINFRVKDKSEMSADGKKKSLGKTKKAVYKKGTIFTARSIIKNEDGSIWANTPSGYVCLTDNTIVYCDKI